MIASMRPICGTWCRVAAMAFVAWLTACGGDTPPAPPPTPDTGVVPGTGEGPVALAFVSASVPPGSTLSGCGADARGCAGRLRMSFRLVAPTAGPVLRMNVFLHSTLKRACLIAETGPFDLPAGPTVLEVLFDRADECATPLTIATMAAVLTARVQTSGRQEWGLRYELVP